MPHTTILREIGTCCNLWTSESISLSQEIRVLRQIKCLSGISVFEHQKDAPTDSRTIRALKSSGKNSLDEGKCHRELLRSFSTGRPWVSYYTSDVTSD